MQIITDTSALSALCERLSAVEYVTVDTEFLRESTYWPILCLVQVAAPVGKPDEEGAIIDPMAEGIDLAPFWDLMRNTDVLKVFHAARQDLEIMWHMGEVIPEPLFDTQVAATVCGFGESVGYEAIVRVLARQEIDKSSRFTDWSRRPLSQKQLDYAISDVTHLRTVFEALYDKLDEQNRHEWVADEMRVLTSPETYVTRPEDAWEAHQGADEQAAGHGGAGRGRGLARARGAEPRRAAPTASSRTTPSPSSPSKSRSRWMRWPNCGRYRAASKRSRSGTALLEAVKAGLAADPAGAPEPKRSGGGNGGAGPTVELLKVLLRMVSDNEHVAPRIIASGEDLERIATEDEPDIDAMKGWRRELFGEPARLLRDGRLALAMENGRVALVARDEEAQTVLGGRAKSPGRGRPRRRSGSRRTAASRSPRRRDATRAVFCALKRPSSFSTTSPSSSIRSGVHGSAPSWPALRT